MASWIPARGKQWPSILFDNAGPETVLCTIYFRPCRHRRLAKCRLNSGFHSPHGVRPSLTLDTIPADYGSQHFSLQRVNFFQLFLGEGEAAKTKPDRRCDDCIEQL